MGTLRQTPLGVIVYPELAVKGRWLFIYAVLMFILIIVFDRLAIHHFYIDDALVSADRVGIEMVAQLLALREICALRSSLLKNLLWALAFYIGWMVLEIVIDIAAVPAREQVLYYLFQSPIILIALAYRALYNKFVRGSNPEP